MGVQDYRRLFIKEGLKMKVQQKIGTKKEVEEMHAISFMWDTVRVPILSHVIHTDKHTDKQTYWVVQKKFLHV